MQAVLALVMGLAVEFVVLVVGVPMLIAERDLKALVTAVTRVEFVILDVIVVMSDSIMSFVVAEVARVQNLQQSL